VDINGGAPEKAVARGFSAWKRVAKKTPVVPTAGELAIITAAEITSYGAAMATAGMRELHFYLDGPKFDHAKSRCQGSLTVRRQIC